MSETLENPIEQEKKDQATATQKSFKDPYEFLASIPNAPARDKVEAWKLQAPNNRLRVFTPDNGKRVFVVRAIGGAELSRLQDQLPTNMQQAKAEQEIQYLVGSACVVWTNTVSGKVSAEELRNGSAGLPSTLFSLISWISDFVDPESFTLLSAEL